MLKLRNPLLLLALCTMAYITFTAKKFGPADNGVGDRTSSPVASGTCSNCHGGGSFGTTITLAVRNEEGDTVTEYIPGTTYSLNFAIQTTSNPGAYGLQSVALLDDDSKAGDLSVPSSESQIVSLGGREYYEHDTPSSGSEFDVSWTAPTTGSGDVTFYFIGNAVDGTGGTGGDDPSSAQSLTLTETTCKILRNDTVSICKNDSVLLGGVQRKTEGSYQDTITNVTCDTIRTVWLDIDTFITMASAASICLGDSHLVGDSYFKTEGLHIDTTTSSTTCDTIWQVTLDVDTFVTTTDTLDICSGDSALIHGNHEKASGIFIDTITAAGTCDTISTVVLRVDSFINVNENRSICLGDSSLIFGNQVKVAGTYIDTTSAASSCDTIWTIVLTVDTYVVQATDTTTINQGDSVMIHGTFQSNAGLYTDTIAVAGTCDTIRTTLLQVNVTSFIDQWNRQPQAFISTFPNPTHGQLYVQFSTSLGEGRIEVLHPHGQIVWAASSSISAADQLSIDLSRQAAGMYIVRWIGEGEIIQQPILKLDD